MNLFLMFSHGHKCFLVSMLNKYFMLNMFLLLHVCKELSNCKILREQIDVSQTEELKRRIQKPWPGEDDNVADNGWR